MSGGNRRKETRGTRVRILTEALTPKTLGRRFRKEKTPEKNLPGKGNSADLRRGTLRKEASKVMEKEFSPRGRKKTALVQEGASKVR